MLVSCRDTIRVFTFHRTTSCLCWHFKSSPFQNPDFYNWNRAKIQYCDGASLSGDTIIEAKNGRKLLFRGQHIWEAIMDALLREGLGKAKQVVLRLSYIVTVSVHLCQRRLSLNALQMLASSLMKRIFLGKEPCNLSMMKLSIFRCAQCHILKGCDSLFR